MAFPGHDDLSAEVEPVPVSPEMEAALPAPSVHISNVAEITLIEGEFPESGAELSYHRETPPPSGTFSVIAHWNEDEAEWEPVQTRQSEDGLTLTAAVEHFSAYSIIDLFKDVADQLTSGDLDALQRAHNGVNQWLGLQAPPPVCGDTPVPAWAEHFTLPGASVIAPSCAYASSKNPDHLMVKMVVNRSYAGYFVTPAEPVCVQQSGFALGHKGDDDLECSREPICWDTDEYEDDGWGSDDPCTRAPEGLPDEFVAGGYLDWKAAGSKMLNSGLISMEGAVGNGVYPAMAFSTYTFEFDRNSVLKAWPETAANGDKLISFETNWKFAMAGLIGGIVDLGVATDDRGNLKFLTVALQINDCSRTFPGASNQGSDVPGGDRIAAIINCLSLAKVWELVDLETDPAGENASKIVRKLFVLMAQATIVNALVSAMYDVASDETQRAFYARPQGGPWSWYRTPDGYFQFMLPAGWKVQKRPYTHFEDYWVVTNQNGQEMATLIPGMELVEDLSLERSGAPDLGIWAHGIPDWRDGSNFTDVAYMPKDDGSAHISLTSQIEDAASGSSYWANGFVDGETFPYREGSMIHGGHSFMRLITADDELTGVDPSLRGMDRLKAYEETEEFQAVLHMIASVRFGVKLIAD